MRTLRVTREQAERIASTKLEGSRIGAEGRGVIEHVCFPCGGCVLDLDGRLLTSYDVRLADGSRVKLSRPGLGVRAAELTQWCSEDAAAAGARVTFWYQ